MLYIDRFKVGTLTLYNSSQMSVFSCQALGRSADNTPMNVTNGNTPIGYYDGWLDGPVSPSDSYGPNKVVMMTGGSGNVYVPPRSGIWIHGGRDQSTLTPTYGCVRAFDRDMLSLSNHITALVNSGHSSTGVVFIDEI
jgi:hypothetical protein